MYTKTQHLLTTY